MKLQVKPGVGERDESSSPLADKEDPAEKERPPPGLGLLGPPIRDRGSWAGSQASKDPFFSGFAARGLGNH